MRTEIQNGIRMHSSVSIRTKGVPRTHSSDRIYPITTEITVTITQIRSVRQNIDRINGSLRAAV